MNSGLLRSEDFQKGLSDYFYLIDKNYPEKGALKLVGDRYKLSKEFRTILYRGVSSHEDSKKREKRLVERPGNILVIDGYNVLFTLLNYRLGRFVFICADSVCRDAGSLFGKIKKEKYFHECLILLIDYLSNIKDVLIEIFLDSPVSMSKTHKLEAEMLLDKYNIEGKVHLVPSADFELLHYKEGTIATSDSAIIDQSSNPILDIPRYIIEKNYKTELYNLKDNLDSLSI